ncbi:MAG TPA: tetratricopeptide repeat protein, partial [Candidatus Obscuribacter sp.]|nr:tetratricopeptide repeat protein [Candidatus Obscuribacter sp.]
MESVTSLPVGALTSEPTSATSEISVKLPLSSGAGQENLFDHALMARAYLSEGRFDEAERLYKLALDVSQDFYG